MNLKINIILILFLCILTCQSQTSRLTIPSNKVPGFYTRVTISTLIVPLKDRPDHEDTALIDAVNKYWKICPVKFVNFAEFNSYRKSKAKIPACIYLLKETYERLKYNRKDWAYTKFYLTPEPGGVEILDAPYIEFKVPIKSRNKDISMIDNSFIYGLILKQMNYDVMLMNDKEKYSKIKRSVLISDDFKNGLKEYASKNLLVSRYDLENYMMNMPDENKTEKCEPEFLNYIAAKTKIDISRIKFVPEEEIKKAVLENDTSALIYTGFTIYNASDGKMLRRIDVSSSKRKVHSAFTFSLSAFMVAASAFLFTLRI